MVESTGPAPSPSASAQNDVQTEDVQTEVIAELVALAQLLKQGRENQGLSVAQLAQRLHMGQEQLAALEQGDSSRLPEPVFVIAQARRIASALGLDVGPQIEALRSSAAFQQQGKRLNAEVIQANAQLAQAVPVAVSRRVASKQAAGQSGGLGRGLVWIPVGLLVCAGGWGLWMVRAQLAVVAASVQTTVLTMAKPPAVEPPAPGKPAAGKPLSKPPAAITAAGGTPATGTSAAQQTGPLIVRSAQTSWLEVTSLNGKNKLFRGMFRGEKRFAMEGGIRLLAGRPDLVQVVEGGKPARTLGTIKDIRWFQFKPAQPPSAAAPSQALKQPVKQPGQTPR